MTRAERDTIGKLFEKVDATAISIAKIQTSMAGYEKSNGQILDRLNGDNKRITKLEIDHVKQCTKNEILGSIIKIGFGILGSIVAALAGNTIAVDVLKLW